MDKKREVYKIIGKIRRQIRTRQKSEWKIEPLLARLLAMAPLFKGNLYYPFAIAAIGKSAYTHSHYFIFLYDGIFYLRSSVKSDKEFLSGRYSNIVDRDDLTIAQKAQLILQAKQDRIDWFGENSLTGTML